MQMIPVQAAQLPLAVVDYAHTPDAVAKALQALKNVALQRQGQLWCVMGCGGDRDASKRPLMTQAAEQVADQVVLTSDNPRTEDPVHILEQMSLGMRNPMDARVIVDRALAIEKILSEAGPADVVLIAGKGHEDYQEIAGVRHPFSDIEHAQRVLQRLAQRASEDGA
jgi:UDP-N-acetylmuramoyl-L-alanyl-D-glutamate--2,6-diaminopimelate ligase